MRLNNDNNNNHDNNSLFISFISLRRTVWVLQTLQMIFCLFLRLCLLITSLLSTHLVSQDAFAALIFKKLEKKETYTNSFCFSCQIFYSLILIQVFNVVNSRIVCSSWQINMAKRKNNVLVAVVFMLSGFLVFENSRHLFVYELIRTKTAKPFTSYIYLYCCQLNRDHASVQVFHPTFTHTHTYNKCIQ